MTDQQADPQSPPPTNIPSQKEIHTIILDTAPLLTSTPALYTQKSENIITIPSVLAEIRDSAARQRLDTIWKPLLTIRSPKQESIKHVTDFSKKTGDYEVLSVTDLLVIAMSWEVWCEEGGRSYYKRLKKIGGSNPEKEKRIRSKKNKKGNNSGKVKKAVEDDDGWTTVQPGQGFKRRVAAVDDEGNVIGDKVDDMTESVEDVTTISASSDSSDNEDEGEWITPESHEASTSTEPSSTTATTTTTKQKHLQIPAACVTADYAMQNVLLQLRIHLYSPEHMMRIASVRSHILRCHGCFTLCRDLSKQFCPNCGGSATMTRVACGTERGEFKLFMKKNWQWNNRGNVYSIPKPKHGCASGKGPSEVILREDQKEYEKAKVEGRRRKEIDLMDRDYLPGLITGERRAHGGIKVGFGRNVNAVKRK